MQIQKGVLKNQKCVNPPSDNAQDILKKKSRYLSRVLDLQHNNLTDTDAIVSSNNMETVSKSLKSKVDLINATERDQRLNLLKKAILKRITCPQ